MITETQNVDALERDIRANRYGYEIARAREHAETFGRDTMRMIKFTDPDRVRLQARCAFRCASLELERMEIERDEDRVVSTSAILGVYNFK